jgi:hypothetical protein
MLKNISFLAILIIAIGVICTPKQSFSAETAPFIVEIADVGKSNELVSLLAKKGITAIIPPKNMRVVNEQSNCTVWIGKNVPLATIQTVLGDALQLYPYLQFFYIVGDRGEKPPVTVDNTIHIGGSVEAALTMKLNGIDREEFKKTLASVKTVEELHKYLHEKNSVRPKN